MGRPQKNNAEYFSHDSDMRNDIKIKALRRTFGNNGYAVWCFTLEMLTASDGLALEYTDLTQELMAADFDLTLETLRGVIAYCIKLGLLQLDGKCLYCSALKKRLAGVMEMRERRANAGRTGMANRWKRTYSTDNSVITVLSKNEENDNSVITMLSKNEENDNSVITMLSKNEENDNSVITADNKVKESKGKESKPKEKDIEYPYSDIASLWNEICGAELPKVKVLSENRRKKIRCRLAENGVTATEEMKAWAAALFQRIAASPFLCGGNANGWAASFDWIFDSPANCVKVLEGNYDRRGGAAGRRPTAESLGVGEYLTPEGRRTYGTGRANIPLSAPPRPSDKYQWSAESGNWIML